MVLSPGPLCFESSGGLAAAHLPTTGPDSPRSHSPGLWGTMMESELWIAGKEQLSSGEAGRGFQLGDFQRLPRIGNDQKERGCHGHFLSFSVRLWPSSCLSLGGRLSHLWAVGSRAFTPTPPTSLWVQVSALHGGLCSPSKPTA